MKHRSPLDRPRDHHRDDKAYASQGRSSYGAFDQFDDKRWAIQCSGDRSTYSSSARPGDVGRDRDDRYKTPSSSQRGYSDPRFDNRHKAKGYSRPQHIERREPSRREPSEERDTPKASREENKPEKPKRMRICLSDNAPLAERERKSRWSEAEPIRPPPVVMMPLAPQAFHAAPLRAPLPPIVYTQPPRPFGMMPPNMHANGFPPNTM